MEDLKLYIVDDESIILDGLVNTYPWEELGFRVAGASVNPEKALLEIEERDVDVVITDVRMKRMSGLDMIRRLKERRPDILCVVISAYRDFTYAQEACELGAFTYLLKPLEDEKFLSAMAAAGTMCRQQKRSREIVRTYENGARAQEEIWEEEALQNIRHNAREYISGALRYIKENLHEESLNIKDVAQEVHLNSMYFGRIFKQCMEMSFKQYLQEERIQKAKELLLHSNATVNEIGERVGIPNPSYFTQLFKRQTGFLPTEYRKESDR